MRSVMNSLSGLFPVRGKPSGTMPDVVAPYQPEAGAKPSEAPADVRATGTAPEPAPTRSAMVRPVLDPADIGAAEDEALQEPGVAEGGKVARDPALEERVMEAIKTVRDPEIPVDLVALGLIYDFSADVNGKVAIEMTLTTPNCPSAAELPGEIETAARSVDGVKEVDVKLVFTPPWHMGMMSEEAKLELGML